MTIFIKDMVCLRCKLAVETILDSLTIKYVSVQLGRADLKENLTPPQVGQLNSALQKIGLEIIDNSKKILVERIKVVIIDMLHSSNDDIYRKFSEHLSKSLNYDYTYLANTFSEQEGSTIEKFYILNKVERVKELLVYENLSLKEIAYQLNYSNVSHLCIQFKKVAGQTPSAFKKLLRSDKFEWRPL